MVRREPRSRSRRRGESSAAAAEGGRGAAEGGRGEGKARRNTPRKVGRPHDLVPLLPSRDQRKLRSPGTVRLGAAARVERAMLAGRGACPASSTSAALHRL
jgi:hypothetical protein